MKLKKNMPVSDWITPDGEYIFCNFLYKWHLYKKIKGSPKRDHLATYNTLKECKQHVEERRVINEN